jgi:hypothetical protein
VSNDLLDLCLLGPAHTFLLEWGIVFWVSSIVCLKCLKEHAVFRYVPPVALVELFLKCI